MGKSVRKRFQTRQRAVKFDSIPVGAKRLDHEGTPFPIFRILQRPIREMV